MEFVNHGSWKRSMHLQDSFPNHRGTKELPRQGVSGTGGNTDGNSVSFLSQACPGHIHCIGGGKPPPPTVPLMQNYGVLTITERASPRHGPFDKGVDRKHQRMAEE